MPKWHQGEATLSGTPAKRKSPGRPEYNLAVWARCSILTTSARGRRVVPTAQFTRPTRRAGVGRSQVDHKLWKISRVVQYGTPSSNRIWSLGQAAFALCLPGASNAATTTASALAAARAGAVSLSVSVETSQLARDPDSDAAQLAFSKPNAIANIAQLSKMNLIWSGAFVSAEPPPREGRLHHASLLMTAAPHPVSSNMMGVRHSCLSSRPGP